MKNRRLAPKSKKSKLSVLLKEFSELARKKGITLKEMLDELDKIRHDPEN